jgi:hypothetical protein
MALVQPALYILCILTSVGCAVLLVRQYRAARTRLLLWSALCFVGLSVANVLLFVDLVVLPTTIDLRPYRHLATLAALGCLVYGFIRDGDA